ncbi:tRNA (guanine(9)-N(1))-methyltransferase [Ophidiomyces ophidiicola]|nr:tRNA (guanine(9)-N(1))-methyltransferase [Ophidiomyces ophidiicola]KAI2146429.1 tRNA (guanine(9)-N(1))-methyltransferase [Ophidiomyces ophidiicola]KAI2214763.1 tRNA (guanine(9)-N(1))-methyltransferase [Ophidiomyces ophidiicola]KAI2425423.1 tRNA (guanine(9)-N(1))-methyltransferase [Ophidiomyces ophidiicola]KAI2459648.1 tRNA (guanine(9)-N(1))-methyltransferase [Ophidiomyces ophidiicola]
MDQEERPRKLQKLDHAGSMASIAEGTTSATNDSLNENQKSTSRANSDATIEKDLKTGASETAALSKNQLKKLKKLERWEASREWRKERRKEKLKEKRDRKREEKVQSTAQTNFGPSELPVSHDSLAVGRVTLRDLRKKDNGNSVLLPVTLVIDCDFDDLMLEKERKSLASQITRAYSDNSRSKYRSHLVVSSFNGFLKQRFDTVLTKQYERWRGVTMTEENFVTAAEAAQARMKQPRGGKLVGVFSNKVDIQKAQLEEEGEIIYLTSDSSDTLTELKPYSTYVIGGLVDKNRHKGICYKRAVEKGIKTAKLPIGEYMQMSSRYVLATNHVVEIIIRWLELGDWGQAFDQVIPKRKGGTLKCEDVQVEKVEKGNGDGAQNKEPSAEIPNEECQRSQEPGDI